jgi:hypothetical protein
MRPEVALMTGCGPLRRFVAVQRDACSGRTSGRSADAADAAARSRSVAGLIATAQVAVLIVAAMIAIDTTTAVGNGADVCWWFGNGDLRLMPAHCAPQRANDWYQRKLKQLAGRWPVAVLALGVFLTVVWAGVLIGIFLFFMTSFRF